MMVTYTVRPSKPPARRPTISAASLRPRSFKARRGTTLSLTLPEAERVKAVIYRAGHKVRGRCMTSARTGRTCKIKQKTLIYNASGGRNRFKIKTSGLRRGSYTLVITASNSGGISGKRTLRFKIIA